MMPENVTSQEVAALPYVSPILLWTSFSVSHSLAPLRTWEPSHTRNIGREWEHPIQKASTGSQFEPSSWVGLSLCTSLFCCGSEFLAKAVCLSRNRAEDSQVILSRLFCTANSLHEMRYLHNEQFRQDSCHPWLQYVDLSWDLWTFLPVQSRWYKQSCDLLRSQSWSCWPWCLCEQSLSYESARVLWLSEFRCWELLK